MELNIRRRSGKRLVKVEKDYLGIKVPERKQDFKKIKK
jgi:hypothetical protein